MMLACNALLVLAVISQVGKESSVPLYLPFEMGFSCEVLRGNNEGPSHLGESGRYAIDFRADVGTPVYASASGIVRMVKEDTEGPTGVAADNNMVSIEQLDGMFAMYAHLMKDGSVVEVGDSVLAGDLIGYSGNTGYSTLPHLHFEVRRDLPLGPSVPCKFEDVEGGVPVKGQTVTSLNYEVRRLLHPLLVVEELYDFSSQVDCLEAISGEMEKIFKEELPSHALKEIKKNRKRTDLEAIWKVSRRNLLSRYMEDAERSLAAIQQSMDDEDYSSAVELATFALRDFSAIQEVHPKLRMAEEKLKGVNEYSDLREALEGRKIVRKSLAKVIAMDLKASQSGSSRSLKKVAQSYRSFVSRHEQFNPSSLIVQRAEKLGEQ